MSPTLRARSISLRAARTLQPQTMGRVLASFESVCDLVTDEGAVVALAWDGIGNGPLNIVLDRGPGAALPAGTRFAVSSRCDRLSLALGQGHTAALDIMLATAIPWNAKPDWAGLRTRWQQVVSGMAIVGRLLANASGQAQCFGRSTGPICSSHPVLHDLIALCGRGPGLTPAGDDWLAGWLLALWLSPDLRSAGDLGGLILKAAAARTTTLSQAFLACAVAGEADADWHALLDALAHQPTDEPAIVEATRTVLGHGATSGAAMLAGFLAGLNTTTAFTWPATSDL